MAKGKNSGGRKAQNTAKRQAKKYAKKHKKGVALAIAIFVIVIVIILLVTYLLKPDLYKDFFNDLYYSGQQGEIENGGNNNDGNISNGNNNGNNDNENAGDNNNGNNDDASQDSTDDTSKDNNDDASHDSTDDDAEGTNGSASAQTPTGDKNDITTSEFSIHFLELGNVYTGDSTLIKCGDTEVLIDAGSRQSSATTIKSYVDQYCTDGKLEYVISTHAHQDHIAGFVGTGSGTDKTGILYKYSVGTLIQFAGHNTSSTIYNNYVSAVEYAKTNGASVYTAKQCWYETDGASKSYSLNEDGTLTLNILYNYYYDNTTSDENNYSVCVLLTYAPEGEKAQNFLFTGDLESEGEASLVSSNTLPEVELFKGGHHGSKTSSTEALLSVIKPKNVAVCCCAGSTEYTTNNDNTFPTQAFVDRVSQYTKNVYVTTLCIDYKAGTYEAMNGNIVFYYGKSEGEATSTLKLYCSNNYTLLKDTTWFQTNRTTPTAWL